MTSPRSLAAKMAAKHYHDNPQWQSAQREYLAGDGEPDEVFYRRVRAACRLRAIEKAREARQQRRRRPLTTPAAALIIAAAIAIASVIAAVTWPGRATANTLTVSATVPPHNWLIKSDDLSRLTAAGYTRGFQWVICGTLDPVPCKPGQIHTYADYYRFAWAVRHGRLKPGSWAMIDYETWIWTPAAQQARPDYYIKITEQLANRYRIHTIDGPGGSRTWAQLASEDETAARYGASVVSVQSQFGVRYPESSFRPLLELAMRGIRKFRPSMPVLAGLAPDAGGQPVTVAAMLESYRIAVQLGVAGCWLNVHPWAPPRGRGCAPTGCVPTVMSFLSAIGATP